MRERFARKFADIKNCLFDGVPEDADTGFAHDAVLREIRGEDRLLRARG